MPPGDAVHLIIFLRELRCPDLAKVVLYNDNCGAGLLAKNPIFHSKTKHIDIRHHYIRIALQKYPVRLEYLPTERMIADVLTKGLPRTKHAECTWTPFAESLDAC